MTNTVPVIDRPAAPAVIGKRSRRRALPLFTPAEPLRLFHAFRA